MKPVYIMTILLSTAAITVALQEEHTQREEVNRKEETKRQEKAYYTKEKNRIQRKIQEQEQSNKLPNEQSEPSNKKTTDQTASDTKFEVDVSSLMGFEKKRANKHSQDLQKKYGISQETADRVSGIIASVRKHPREMQEVQKEVRKALGQEAAKLDNQGKKKEADQLFQELKNSDNDIPKTINELLKKAETDRNMKWYDYLNPLKLGTSIRIFSDFIQLWLKDVQQDPTMKTKESDDAQNAETETEKQNSQEVSKKSDANKNKEDEASKPTSKEEGQEINTNDEDALLDFLEQEQQNFIPEKKPYVTPRYKDI